MLLVLLSSWEEFLLKLLSPGTSQQNSSAGQVRTGVGKFTLKATRISHPLLPQLPLQFCYTKQATSSDSRRAEVSLRAETLPALPTFAIQECSRDEHKILKNSHSKHPTGKTFPFFLRWTGREWKYRQEINTCQEG